VYPRAGPKTSANLMRPTLHPRLINGPFEDPGLFIPFQYTKRAILFDLGDLANLTPRDLLKVTHVFVSHTHMDHFAGFDTLLRLFLGRNKTLYVYGPQGFLRNVEGKLAAYSWNLVANYQNFFTLVITEVRHDQQMIQTYLCHQEFQPASPAKRQAFTGILMSEPGLTIAGAILDHGIPCLGFSLKEDYHINIKRDALDDMGLLPGPWLNHFKQALYEHTDPGSEFNIPDAFSASRNTFRLHELADKIALITPGQKIGYVVDVGYSLVNAEKITSLVEGSDQLFIEAAFLEKHREVARQKHHLTAWQAGTLAGRANVKHITPFHFSPRYTGQGDLLSNEALNAFKASRRQR
jgi:ribonuclease Z